MENYLETHKEHFVKSRHGVVVDIVLIVVGAALLLVGLKAPLGDSLKMLMLTLGVIAGVVGIVLLAVHCGGASGGYCYKPTGSRMKSHRCYIDTEGRQLCEAVLSSQELSKLKNVRKLPGTNMMLRVDICKDDSCALLQLCEYVPHQFVPVTEVVMISGPAVAEVRAFLK